MLLLASRQVLRGSDRASFFQFLALTGNFVFAGTCMQDDGGLAKPMNSFFLFVFLDYSSN